MTHFAIVNRDESDADIIQLLCGKDFRTLPDTPDNPCRYTSQMSLVSCADCQYATEKLARWAMRHSTRIPKRTRVIHEYGNPAY